MNNHRSICGLSLVVVAATSSSCFAPAVSEPDKQTAARANAKVVSVDPSLFLKEALLAEIVKEERRMADGTSVLSYVLTTRSQPHEHAMGPWAPRTITDGKEAGGIWLQDGKVHDVDGPFIRNVAAFYHDEEWKLFRDDGSIKVTDTKEAFEAAARPNVDPKYQNYVVEGKPEWIASLTTTYVIPVDPVYQTRSTELGRDAVGLAFNGVKFDPPAPVDAILAAHTLAPFDDNGGHLNPHAGYHYHAATGKTKELAQADGHAPMLGYAMDGFGLYAHLDPAGKPGIELDECGAHVDETRGYHYHVGAPGSNQVLKCLHGRPGTMSVSQRLIRDGSPSARMNAAAGRARGHV
jgi:YHYH protein